MQIGIEALIERNPVEVPPGMVEENLEMLKRELSYQAARQGRDPKNLRFSDEQLLDLRQRAVFAARGSLLVESVREQESITVSDADVDARIEELAAANNTSVETLRGWIARDGGIEGLRDRLTEEAVLNWLVDHASGSDAPKADAPKAKATKKAAKAEAAPAPSAEADTSLLDGSIADIKAALESGAHDANLAALLAAEESGRNRKGAISAIKARM